MADRLSSFVDTEVQSKATASAEEESSPFGVSAERLAHLNEVSLLQLIGRLSAE